MAKNLFKRGRIWWGRVQVKGKEKKFSLGTASQAEAQRRLRIKLDELESSQWGLKPRRTFDEAIEKFIDEHFQYLKPSTRRRYGTSILALNVHLQGKYLDEIGSAVLYDFETARRKDVTPSTIMKDFTCLSSLFHCATEWEWIAANPVRAYVSKRKRAGLKESDPRSRYLPVDEERRLFDAMQYQRPRDAVAFAIDTGLRKEEQLSLLKKNVDLAGNRIIVDASIAKNGKRRVVPLLPRAREIAQRLMMDLRSPYLFATSNQNRYSASSPYLWEALQTAARRAGIPKLRWHDLRRTCGCRLLQDHGLNMKEVCDWLGHSSIMVTERIYAFLGEDALQKAILRSEQSPEHGNVVALSEGRKNNSLGD